MLDEITTHLDFYTVIALARALKAFNGAILLVSHDRFLIKSVIEGEAELLDLDENDDFDISAEEEAKLRMALYLLNKGTLTRLENGILEFENSLEKRVAKMNC